MTAVRTAVYLFSMFPLLTSGAVSLSDPPGRLNLSWLGGKQNGGGSGTLGREKILWFKPSGAGNRCVQLAH
jgi:hypothetical protein